jgi:drug/metabolite transporter (DMT)-like permease
MALVCIASSIPALVKLTISRKWNQLHLGPKRWVMGIGLIGSMQFFIQSGLEQLDPAVSDLLFSTWPLFVALFVGILPKERFSLRLLIPAIIGFGGASIICIEQVSIDEGTIYLIFPLIGSLIWTVYVLFSRHYRSDPPEIVGLYFGGAGMLYLFTHLVVRGPSIPFEGKKLIIIALLGIGIIGIAQILWDYCVKRGMIQMVALFANLGPALSLLWLSLFGKTIITARIFVSCGIITASCLIMGWMLRKQLKISKQENVDTL